jgi:hypothetical protein
MTTDESGDALTPRGSENDPGDVGLAARLEALEDAARALAEQMAQLSARVERIEQRGAAAGAPRARPAAAPESGRLPTWREAEAFIGRYGILGLGTLTVLAAVGTFVRWAVARGMLGPEARVVLGLLFAASLATVGLHLRRDERSFGSTLLGLSLAVTHVCAWAAGPLLHVLPDTGAFALAAAASLVLAVFAHAEHEQPLWCVGFGGVAAAPFITSPGGSSTILLAAYGAMISVAGGYSLGARDWRVAERVFSAGVAAYVVALVAKPTLLGPDLAAWLPLIVATAGVLPFAGRDLVRTRLRPLGVFSAGAALFVAREARSQNSSGTEYLLVGIAGLVWLALVDRVVDSPAVRGGARRAGRESLASWVDGAIIPFVITCAAAAAGPRSDWSVPAVMLSGSLALAAFCWRRMASQLLDAAAFAAAACALTAALLAPWTAPGVTAVTTAALGVALAGADRIRPSRSWLAMAFLTLLIGSGRAWWLLHGRAEFAYSPFITRESAASAAVLITWVAATALSLGSADGDRARFGRLAHAGGWCWAFLWAHRELADAFSHATSTLSLVSLEALAAVLAVGAGRAGDARVLRRVGLALAIVAAVRALGAARTVDVVGVRIASYLVASAFLLGIAFWYRRREGEPA